MPTTSSMGSPLFQKLGVDDERARDVCEPVGDYVAADEVVCFRVVAVRRPA